MDDEDIREAIEASPVRVMHLLYEYCARQATSPKYAGYPHAEYYHALAASALQLYLALYAIEEGA